MKFNEKDKKLLERAIKEKLKISVDNDSISVGKNTIDENGEDDFEYIGSFENFGQDFIVQLLNYIGTNADFC